MLNHDGQVITEAGAEQIRQRRNHKAALLEEMRAQRAEAALDRHSHVGTELGRVTPDPEAHAELYRQLGEMSNTLFMAGHTNGAGILASLARGLARATRELFGVNPTDDISHQLTSAMAPKADATYPTEPDDISQPLKEDAVENVSAPQPMAPLTAEDAVTSEPLATFEDDDPDDMPGANEPSASPEPADTPARRAAAQRRATKRASRDN